MCPGTALTQWHGCGSFRRSACDDTGSTTPDIAHVISNLQASFAEQIERERSRADRNELRAERAETRANEAEKALIAERNRADQVEVVIDKLETELEAEEVARAEAEADAAELRQAEAVRRARGRWARLRAAWRGE